MMTLLVPTDFSKASKKAVTYAIELARKIKARIILLNVVQTNTSGETLLKWKRLEEEMVKIAKEDGEALLKEVKKKAGEKTEITFEYRLGYDFAKVVNRFVEENDVDLVIMGTHGATGLKKVLLGSNAASMINTSLVPVIAVPADAAFKPIKKIVYATDMVNLDEEIKTITMFAALFKATVNVVHVTLATPDKKFDPDKFTKNLIKVSKYKKLTFNFAKNETITAGVDAFVAKQKPQLLAMFTHKLSAYEKFFGKGVTRKQAFHTTVPLLSFNKTTIK
ncbi:MAG: universal stress protein [Flammeovirgaceae bacterium]|nr:MAG: universal stress protein [Flammeovirgaceae bacterium]